MSSWDMLQCCVNVCVCVHKSSSSVQGLVATGRTPVSPSKQLGQGPALRPQDLSASDPTSSGMWELGPSVQCQ